MRPYGVIMVLSMLMITGIQSHAEGETTREYTPRDYSIVPPAPGVAQFLDFQNYSVDNFHGLPQISFPIYVIKSGAISVPITLNYHAGGIRTKQKCGNVCQRNGYYPSGTPYVLPSEYVAGDAPAMTAVTDELHIGNHWMSHSGQNMYDNTARLHDPLLMRYGAPDPLAVRFSDMSPYTHCAANPGNAVDPEGMDVYEVDSNGTIQFISKNSFIDMIWGKNSFMVLDHGVISNAVNGIYNYNENGVDYNIGYTYYTLSNSGQEAFNFFMINTDVEWDRIELDDNTSVVGTSNRVDSVASSAAYYENNPSRRSHFTAFDHSHPGPIKQSANDVNLASTFERYSPNIKCKIYFLQNGIIDYYEYSGSSSSEPKIYDGVEITLEKVVIEPK